MIASEMTFKPMKTILLTSFATLLYFSKAYAVPPFPPHATELPVMISLGDGSFGSGFFVGTSNHVFLVTARHVLLNNNMLKSPTATVQWYTTRGTNSLNGQMTLELGNLLRDGQIRVHAVHDVAVVRLAVLSADNSIAYRNDYITNWDQTIPIGALARAEQLRQFSTVNVGDDVYVFGYPDSIGIQQWPVFDYTKPLLSKGIIAGTYNQAGTIIISAAVNHGNSGGPVVEKEEISLTETSFTIIGIVTQGIPFYDQGKYGTFTLSANSGYAVVEPCDYINKLLWDN